MIETACGDSAIRFADRSRGTITGTRLANLLGRIPVQQAIKDSETLKAFNKGKQVPQFAAMVRAEAKERGAAAFALSMPFDEVAVLRQNTSFLEATLHSLGIQSVHVYAGEVDAPGSEA